LYPACKNNNQARGGLGRVCATGMYRSIEHVKLPKFQTGIFVEWKAPEDSRAKKAFQSSSQRGELRLLFMSLLQSECR